MAQFKQWFTQDLTESIVVRHCESVMFTGDDNGAVVGVRLYDNGEAYSGGGTVSGAVKRYDGGLVPLTGTLSGNAASVVIPAVALAYPGPIGVHIVLTQGSSVTTVLKAIYSVDDTSGATVDPGTIIPSINDLITAINTAVDAIPPDYSALVDALDSVETEIYNGDDIAPMANPPHGWKLVSETGLCVEDNNYQLKKYEVSPGRKYYVKTDGLFQFQSSSSVPSYGTSNRIGETITGGGFVVTAPEGAYYLIISTLIDYGVSIVKQVHSRIDDLEKMPILMQGIGISGNVIDLSSIETKDSVISSSGAVSQSANYAYTAGIAVKEGQTIALYACGYLDRVAMISKYASSAYTPVVVSTDSSVKLYTYTADEDCTLVLSYGYRYSHIAMLSSENIAAIGRYLYSDVPFTNVVWGKYISASGVVSGGANDYRYTQPLLLPAGMVIELTGAGYQQSVAMIAKYNGEGVNYTPLVISTDSTVRTYKYHTDKDIYIALSYNNTQEHKASYHLAPSTNVSIDYSVLFPKVSVIGDSLSSGCLHINNSDTDFYGDSWLTFIARRCGLKRNHYSKGGLTCKTWIEQYLAKLQSDEASNAYFIALGTNDSWFNPYEMGTASDAAGANTFAGYYKQILEAVRAKAPNAVIFCLSLYKSNQTYNPLIKAISAQYTNAFYIDVPANSSINPDTGGVWSAGSHFTTLGYRYIANVIYDQMNTIVSANLATFKFFGQHNSVGSQFEF